MCVFSNNWEWMNGALLMIGGECAVAFQMDGAKTETEDDGSVQQNQWILMVGVWARANDEENSLIKTWCDGQRPAGSPERPRVNSVPSGVGSKVIRATHPFLLEKKRESGVGIEKLIQIEIQFDWKLESVIKKIWRKARIVHIHV